MAKYHCSSQEESRKLAERGMEYAERAVKEGAENFACHKWMGVLISYTSEFEGYKRKIERSFDIRDSFKVLPNVLVCVCHFTVCECRVCKGVYLSTPN